MTEGRRLKGNLSEGPPLGIVRIGTDGSVGQAEEILVNPGMPIPPETTAIHGITDDMVRDCPTFKGRADWILERFFECDLSGFNVEKYDLPILRREFARIGMNDVLADAKVIDAMVIYHRNVRRDLSAAVKYYLNRKHDGAHSAGADALATAEVLIKQVSTHNLPKDTAGLHAYCQEKPEGYVDREGLIVWKGDAAVMNFGKMKGMTLQEAAEKNAQYLEWIVGNNFSDEVKAIVKNALGGQFPKR